MTSRSVRSKAARKSAFEARLSASPGIVYYSQDFNGESRRQSVARAVGADNAYTVYDLVHLETDQLILDSHERKQALEALTLEEIRCCL